jgi:hypothetical protein
VCDLTLGAASRQLENLMLAAFVEVLAEQQAPKRRHRPVS